MARFNIQQRKIEIKIVFYGPAFSGKTTNVHRLHGLIPDRFIGDLSALDAEDERTLFFDFFPVHSAGVIEGFQLQVEIFSVPGQAHYRATRHMVLQNADGIIFVADSQSEELKNNLASLADLEHNLRSYNRSLEDCPMVFQYNKQDLPGALPIEILEKELNLRHLPYYEGVAVEGKGVIQCFNAIVDQVKVRLSRDIPDLGSRPGATFAMTTTSNPEAPARTVAELVARIGELGEHRPKEVAQALSRFDGEVNGRQTWGNKAVLSPTVGLSESPGGTYDLQDAELHADGRIRLFFQDTLNDGKELEFWMQKKDLSALFARRKPRTVDVAQSPMESRPVMTPALSYLILIWLAGLSVWLILT